MSKCVYKNRLGKAGESIAMNFLSEKGYKHLKSNYRFERSEIDLIFLDEPNKMIIFVEVKTRRNRKFGEPEESINYSKQQSIKKAADGFMQHNEALAGSDMRIDVVSILISDSGTEINHIENAF